MARCAQPPTRRALAGRGAWMIRLLGRLTLQLEQKYPVLPNGGVVSCGLSVLDAP